MKKHFFRAVFMLSLVLSAGVIVSCGGDNDEVADSNSGSTDIGNNGGNNNGTDAGDNGGNGSSTLSANEEKQFIEETSRLFLGYFDAAEFNEISTALKQIGDKDGDVFDSWMYDAMEDITQTWYYSGYYASHAYYDALIRASNIKGSFSTSYSSNSWTQTSSTGDFTLTFTDRNNAVWVLKVVPSGKTMGRFNADNAYDRETIDTDGKYKEEHYDLTLEVPERVTATLTRQGVTQASADLQISNLNLGDDGKVSAMSRATATAVINVLAFNTNVSFSYSPNSGSSISATLKKGDTTIFNFSVKGTPRVDDDELSNATNVTGTFDVLGRLQAHVTCTDIKTLADALDKAGENDYDGDIVSACAATANGAFTAYITNNGGSAQQATIKLSRTSEKSYGYTYYELTPTINFSDGTSYAFYDYFTKSYFQAVIDTYNRIVKDFEKLAN